MPTKIEHTRRVINTYNRHCFQIELTQGPTSPCNFYEKANLGWALVLHPAIMFTKNQKFFTKTRPNLCEITTGTCAQSSNALPTAICFAGVYTNRSVHTNRIFEAKTTAPMCIRAGADTVSDSPGGPFGRVRLKPILHTAESESAPDETDTSAN